MAVASRSTSRSTIRSTYEELRRESENASADESQNREQQKLVRVIEPVLKRSKVDTHRALASTFCGVRSKEEASCFHMVVRDGVSFTVFWVFWWTGLVLGLISLPEAWIDQGHSEVTRGLSFCSLLMLPLPIATCFVLSLDLVVEVLRQVETYIVAMCHIEMVFIACRLLVDIRALFWVCMSPSLLIAMFVDAYPSHYRRCFSIIFSLGMIVLVVAWCVMLMAGYAGSNANNTTWQLLHMMGNSVTTTVNGGLTLAIFYIRHIVIASFRPNCFVVICSEVRTDRRITCTCGNIFMPDAQFCRTCGRKRPLEDLALDLKID